MRDNRDEIGIEALSIESYDLTVEAFAKIWPKMSDPDLKSIFRSLADGWEGQLSDESDFTAWVAICDV